MAHIMPKYRIAITPTTENDLHALRYAFEGNMAHGEHQECSDDVLVAALLGWQLRKIGRKRDFWIKSLAYEFGMRVNISKGFAQTDEDDEDMQKLQNLRKGSRGTSSTPGNLLTIDGIDSHTLTRIKTRAHAVERMVQKINDIYNNEPNSYMQIMETLARYSDQAIIDLGIWWTLTVMQDEDHEVEEFPYWVKDQIAARADVREECEASQTIKPVAELVAKSHHFPNSQLGIGGNSVDHARSARRIHSGLMRGFEQLWNLGFDQILPQR